METESVRSGRSDRSRNSQMSRPNHGNRRVHGHRSDRHEPERQHLRGGMDSDTDRDDRSVSTRASRRVRHGLAAEFIPESNAEGMVEYGRNGPPDSDWGDNTTVITGATSEVAYSLEDVRMGKDLEEGIGFRCARYAGAVLAGIVSIVSFFSPIIMVVLPKIDLIGWKTDVCQPDCESLLLGMGFKLLVLLIGTWALFFRRPRATLPRIDAFRAIVLFIAFLLSFAFWLFYGVRIFQKQDTKYIGIVTFAVSLVDGLLFVHYLAVVLLEIRQLQNQFIVKLVRSPDGESHSYTAGQMTVQSLAVWCLEQYYKDFQVYNPYLENLPRRSASRTAAFKIYDVDGGPTNGPAFGPRAAILATSASSGHRESGHNDRFYEEQEYDRRVQRRKARLQVATEEAFAHIKRLQKEPGENSNMQIFFHIYS